MDGEKFDDLLKRLCTTRLTRISALRGLVAGAAAALTGATLASDETDARKKGGKGRKKSSKGRAKAESRVGAEAKGRSGGKKDKSSGRRGQKGKQPRTKQRLQTESVIPFGCEPGHVALCHNSDASNGGSIICPSASSADLAGHCNHDGPGGAPGSVLDCYCPNGGFIPGVNCPDAVIPLEECGSCNQDGSKCHFVCDPDDCPSPSDQCHVAVCVDNACAEAAKPDGTACNDGLFCTVDDVCTGGVCGGTPRDCSGESDQCNLGVCDEEAGECVAEPKQDDTECNDGLFCTIDDVCTGGICGGSPRDCSASGDQCNDGVCNEDANECQARPKQDGTACNDGLFCTIDDVCTGGVCGGDPRDCSGESDQCNLGVCDEDENACVKQPTPGETCNDGLFCTVGDTCDAAGDCVGSPRDCSASGDQCNDGVCNEDANECQAQPKTDGTECNDGLFCSVDDVCTGGVCGGDPRDCSAAGNQCNNGVCNEEANECQAQPKPNGTACSDGKACTVGDACQAGQCVGGGQKVCLPVECRPNCICTEPNGDCVCTGTTCTLTQGYWKNHVEKWPPIASVRNVLGDQTVVYSAFYKSGKTWLQALQASSSGGDGYYALAQQFIAAVFNIASGACAPAAVTDAIKTAAGLFKGTTNTFNKSQKTVVTNLIKILTDYNEGKSGPGHCN